MKIANSFCLAFVAVIVVSACNTPVHSISQTKTNQPDWIISTQKVGAISVVGFAPRQMGGDTAKQRRVALTKAHQQLGEIVRVRVENTFQDEMHVEHGYSKQTVDYSTRLSSHAALNLDDAEVTAEWIDPEDGVLYLLLELTVRPVK